MIDVRKYIDLIIFQPINKERPTFLNFNKYDKKVTKRENCPKIDIFTEYSHRILSINIYNLF